MQFYLQLWRNFHEQCLQKDRHARTLEFPEYTQNRIIVKVHACKQKTEIFVNVSLWSNLDLYPLPNLKYTVNVLYFTSNVCIKLGLIASFIKTVNAPLTP